MASQKGVGNRAFFVFEAPAQPLCKTTHTAGDHAFFYAYNGCMKKIAFYLLLTGMLVAAPFSQAAASAADVPIDVPAAASWLQQGLPALALTALPDNLAPDAPTWASVEALRWQAMAQLHQDDALLQRIARTPAAQVPAMAGLMADIGAPAALRQKNPVQALNWLAQAIWLGQPTAAQLREWRVQVVRASLAAGEVRAAYADWLKYQQDYRDAELSLAQEVTQALALGGLVQDALMMTARPDLSAGLRAWVQLKAGLLDPAQAVAGMPKLLAKPDVWVLMAEQEAAIRLKMPGLAIGAEEAMLSRYPAEQCAPLGVDAERLWDDYQKYAAQLANENNLLQGQDADWQALADRLASDNPAGQRALLAYIAVKGVAAERRDAAADALLNSWRTLGATALVADAPQLQVGDKVRWNWGYAAFEQGKPAVAGRWWAALPPDFTVNDWASWPLARMQALLAAGQRDEARALLGAVGYTAVLPADDAARVLDVARSWAEGGQVTEARQWLHRLQPVLDGADWRNALRWRGRLAMQQHDYTAAAADYLAVAAAAKGNEAAANRQLAQEALWLAGMYNDARALAPKPGGGR